VAKVGSSVVVTGLTGSALAVVTMLALQAKSSATVTAPGTTAAGGASASGPATPGKPGKAPVDPLPGGTGTDKRVVYSLSERRVWLVEAGAKTAERTFAVQPSAVSPLTGSYVVYGLNGDAPYTGSDGVEIEDGVLFASHDGVTIGFSAAVNGSMASPAPDKHTGGIREPVADGKALYAFSQKGMPVIVVQ
jgi:hypothetical protein